MMADDEGAFVGVARDEDVSVKSEDESLLMAEGDMRWPMGEMEAAGSRWLR